MVPRVVGTPSHQKVKEFIIGEVQKFGWVVETDPFDAKTPNFGTLRFENIIAKVNPSARQVLVLSCHYDSKYYRNIEFLGATDSAVPCAMLINLAHALQSELPALKKADVGLELWFFDGEEAFVRWGPTDSIYGARHLASKMERENSLDVPVIHWIPSRFPDVWHTSSDNFDAIDMVTVEDMNTILRLFILRYYNL
ncbi:glutaminyl-peptide cyclotransferase [Frankliniella occidentalis]|nr:glutaminyl-peptide cyclotransferase [Frankliniella occidentalis]